MEHIHGVCGDANCEHCNWGFDHGIYIACDECDHAGSNEYGYPVWQLQEDGRVLCDICADDEQLIRRPGGNCGT